MNIASHVGETDDLIAGSSRPVGCAIAQPGSLTLKNGRLAYGLGGFNQTAPEDSRVVTQSNCDPGGDSLYGPPDTLLTTSAGPDHRGAYNVQANPPERSSSPQAWGGRVDAWGVCNLWRGCPRSTVAIRSTVASPRSE